MNRMQAAINLGRFVRTSNGLLSINPKFLCINGKYQSTNSYMPRIPIVGNPNFQPFVDKVVVKRWQRHWLLAMQRKSDLEGVPKQIPRCNELNWNMEAELIAFCKRLKIDVYEDLLCAAFTEPLPVSEDHVEDEFPNNNSLVFLGKKVVYSFVNSYLMQYFPNVSNECREAIEAHLTSETLTAYLAANLGIVDFIQCKDYPFSTATLSRCFYSTVGAIYCSNNGIEEAAKFVLDFVITDLVDQDIVENIWKPVNPMKLFNEECKNKGLGIVEVRLTKQSGINTLLPLYFVGLYIDKEMYVESGGETLPLVEKDLALLALKKLYRLNPEDVVLPLRHNTEADLTPLLPEFETNHILQEHIYQEKKVKKQKQ